MKLMLLSMAFILHPSSLLPTPSLTVGLPPRIHFVSSERISRREARAGLLGRRQSQKQFSGGDNERATNDLEDYAPRLRPRGRDGVGLCAVGGGAGADEEDALRAARRLQRNRGGR